MRIGFRNALEAPLDIDTNVNVSGWARKGVDMQIKEAAERLGVSERMLRHYEKERLLEARRAENGYRRYSEADLRRAGRIRDLIATGFSTREIRAMAACLSDQSAGLCEEGIPQLLLKLEHIERMRADLDARREAILSRLAMIGDTAATLNPQPTRKAGGSRGSLLG